MSKNSIGNCVLEARLASGLSQAELAGMCGLSKETIIAYENGTKAVRPNFLNWVAAERLSRNKKAQQFALAFSDAITGKRSEKS